MDLAKPDRTLDHNSLPTPAEANQIKLGDFCRLSTKSGARFWGRVIGIKPNGVIHALVEDNIEAIGMKRGQLVVFDKGNVFEIV